MSASSNTMTGFLPPSSKCTRLSVGAPCAWIIEPVDDSPTKAIALMSGCSVRLLPAVSPMPCTTFSTPAGRPASSAISASRCAVKRAPLGRFVDHAAAGRKRGRDLPRTQHERRVPRRDHAHRPDRSAGRVVDDVFGRGRDLAVVGARGLVGEEAEVRGAAQRSMTLMNRMVWPVSTHSVTAISCVRSRRSDRRPGEGCASVSTPLMALHTPKPSVAAFAAASISAASPAETSPRWRPSIGD